MKMEWKRKGTGQIPEIKEKNNVVWLSYPELERTGMVKHGFSTRLGGVSTGCLSAMNLSFSRGDEEENVFENFRRIADAIGFSEENIVISHQTHTTNVRKVTKDDRGKGIFCPRDYTDVDGLITNVPGLVLTTFYADCVPLFFVDPVHRAIGLSHSGWRGTVHKMGKVTVEAMTREYGSRPEDLITAIGPSICQDCYEVSSDVIEEFAKNFADQDQSLLYEQRAGQKEKGKYQLNLWEANKMVLKEAGILPEHISVTNICTCCNPDLLFSHRASLGKRGNLAAFLMLAEN